MSSHPLPNKKSVSRLKSRCTFTRATTSSHADNPDYGYPTSLPRVRVRGQEEENVG